MPNTCSWLFRSIVALIAAGACASALAATPAQIGVFRNGEWFLDANGDGVYTGPPNDIYYVFGKAGDIPVVGDWNGDGITKIGVFRNSVWYLDYNGNGVWDEGIDKVIVFGNGPKDPHSVCPGDYPVVGDWNGDGRDKIGVYRNCWEANGQWPQGPTVWRDINGDGVWVQGVDAADNALNGGTIPVIGDWDGTGTRRFGITTGGKWWLSIQAFSQDIGTSDCVFGLRGDIPVVGDWSGSGTTKIGVFRHGSWSFDYQGGCYPNQNPTGQYLNYGQSGDKPVVAKRWK